jgi:hypothetical protein
MYRVGGCKGFPPPSPPQIRGFTPVIPKDPKPFHHKGEENVTNIIRNQ